MSCDSVVLVVGTTPDYVQWIDQNWPGRAVFLTDPKVRHKAAEPPVDDRTEILIDLRRFKRCRNALSGHLQRHNLRLTGITCFDCESMHLTAQLAQSLGLPYPSVHCIDLCQDKYQCKQLWRRNNIPCPDVRLIKSPHDVAALSYSHDKPWIIKPINATGSEMVFFCRDQDEAQAAANQILDHQSQSNNRRSGFELSSGAVAESYIPGPEYSCDLIIKNNEVSIIRIAEKMRLVHSTFGITRGYLLPAVLPESMTIRKLEKLLTKATIDFDLTEAVCMVDFILGPQGVTLLELTPRPGGDCLPQTIRQSVSLDMLGLALDVAEGHHVHLPSCEQWQPMVGLRIYAPYAGILRDINTRIIHLDSRVREIKIFSKPGCKIMMPPADYDSWILGHIIFAPNPGQSVVDQCDQLLKLLHLNIEGNN